jgi:multidrug efflux pump subunit AcrA (membrane-fusion protein)
MEEYEKIDIRSDEVQDILGTPPAWIVRWGTIIAVVTVGLLIFVSRYVQYSDVVKAPFSLTTGAPPLPIIAKTEGIIERLLVQDKDSVLQDQLIGIMRSPAQYDDIVQVEKQIGAIQSGQLSDFKAFTNYSLGNIQSDYIVLIQAFNDYRASMSNNKGNSRQSIDQLDKEISKYNEAIRLGRESIVGTEDKLKLAKKRADDLKKDYLEQKATVSQLEDQRTRILEYENQVKITRATIAEREANIENAKRQINEFSAGNSTDNTAQSARIKEIAAQVQNAIDRWKQDFLIKSPTTGKVALAQQITKQKYFKSGEEIGTILPNEKMSGVIVARGILPASSIGKVVEGQRTLLKFDSCPFERCGAVEAIVSTKSFVASENHYVVEMLLTKGLRTHQGANIKFEHQLRGTADIITEKKQIWERLFQKK